MRRGETPHSVAGKDARAPRWRCGAARRRTVSRARCPRSQEAMWRGKMPHPLSRARCPRSQMAMWRGETPHLPLSLARMPALPGGDVARQDAAPIIAGKMPALPDGDVARRDAAPPIIAGKDARAPRWRCGAARRCTVSRARCPRSQVAMWRGKMPHSVAGKMPALPGGDVARKRGW